MRATAARCCHETASASRGARRPASNAAREGGGRKPRGMGCFPHSWRPAPEHPGKAPPGAPVRSGARPAAPERVATPARGFLPARAPRPPRRDVIAPRPLRRSPATAPRHPRRESPHHRPAGLSTAVHRPAAPRVQKRKGGGGGDGGRGGAERRWWALETSSGPQSGRAAPARAQYAGWATGGPTWPPPRRRFRAYSPPSSRAPGHRFGAPRVGVWVGACGWGARVCARVCVGAWGGGGRGPAAAWKGQGWGPDPERRGPRARMPPGVMASRGRAFARGPAPGPSRVNSVTAMCCVCREKASQSRAGARSPGHDRRTCRRACIRCP